MATGKKTGGRNKGTPNKTTAEIRECFQLIVENNIEQFENDLQKLEPKERIKIILELSKFIIPTLKSQELNHNQSNDIFIGFDIDDGSDEY